MTLRPSFQEASPMTKKDNRNHYLRRIEILRFYLRYEREHREPPTLNEVAAALKMKYLAGVHYHLRRMEQDGFLERIAPEYEKRARRISPKGKALLRTEDE